MRAGKLRHRVTVQGMSTTQHAYGEEVVTWATVATVWAAVEPLRGRELNEMAQEQAERTTRIRMRYREVAPGTQRIVWTDRASTTRTYDVLSVVQVLEKGAETELMCREVLA